VRTLPQILVKIATMGSLDVYTGMGNPSPSSPIYFILKTEGNPVLAIASLAAVKLFCRDIMNRNLEDTAIRHQFTEADYSVMAIGIQRQYRAPFVLKITEVLNDIDGKNDMATASQHLTATEENARKWAMTIYDYLYAWEIVSWRRIQDENTVMSAGLLGTPVETQKDEDIFS
jgi:hypothetical protein